MKVFKHRKIKKSYAVKAAMFRRLARKMGCKLDYGMESLVELYEWETYGKKSVPTFDDLKAKNGYAMGKWLRDIDVSMIKEDIENGYFFKIEFLSTPIERIHNTKFLESVMAGSWHD